MCLWLDLTFSLAVLAVPVAAGRGQNGAAGRVTLGVGLSVPSAPVRCGCGDGRARVQILCVAVG